MQEWTRAKLHTCWLMSQKDRLLESRPIPPISSWSLQPKTETIRHTQSCAADIQNKFFGRFYGLLATLQMLKTCCRKPCLRHMSISGDLKDGVPSPRGSLESRSIPR